MKTVSSSLAASLSARVTTLCRLWTITPRLRSTLHFTDHDKNVTFDGNVYISDKGFEASAVEMTLNSAASNLDIAVLFSADLLRRSDLERGLLIDAAIELRIIDYLHPEYGSVLMFAGNVASVQGPDNQSGVLTVTGNISRLSKSLTEVYQPTCRADFGDTRCGVNIASYSEAVTVTAVHSNNQAFETGDTMIVNAFKLGIMVWTTGDNTGVAQEVVTNEADGTILLFFRPPFAIQVGDTGTLYQGCLKTVAACKAYNNILNFRGEPYVPGDDFINQPPKQLPRPTNTVKVT